MTKQFILSAFTFMALFVLTHLPTSAIQAQSDVYDSGTVWNVGMIRIDANMEEEYLKRLNTTWNFVMKEAVKQGLIKSYKIMLGSESNPSDFNLLLLTEHPNMASFDPNPAKDAKWKAITDKIEANPDYANILEKYGQIRQYFGQKLMREIVLK